MSGTFSNDLINNTIYHLLNFEKHSSFQAAAREAAVNNSFQIVLLSEDFNPIFTVETRHRTTIEKAVGKGMERGSIDKGPFTMIDVEGVLTYWGPVTIDGKKHYMILVDNEGAYSQAEITKLAGILELAMGMWKYSPVRDITAELIKALRRGNRSLAAMLKEEGGYGNEEIRAVFAAEGIEKEAGYKAIALYENQSGEKVVTNAESGELCGIVFHKRSPREGAGAEELRLYDVLAEAGAETVFHAEITGNIEGAADAFQLINETWPFMRHIFPYRKVFTIYELALAGDCINLSLNGGLIKKHYMDLLTPFRKVADTKAKQLLDTLAAFILDANMKVTDTAGILSLHANTVQYRLKRIREILGVDITDMKVAPSLVMALALLRVEKYAGAL